MTDPARLVLLVRVRKQIKKQVFNNVYKVKMGPSQSKQLKTSLNKMREKLYKIVTRNYSIIRVHQGKAKLAVVLDQLIQVGLQDDRAHLYTESFQSDF